jgi:hypothetical protein
MRAGRAAAELAPWTGIRLSIRGHSVISDLTVVRAFPQTTHVAIGVIR